MTTTAGEPETGTGRAASLTRVTVMLVVAGAIGSFGYQMARNPVLPLFGHSLGATGAFLGLIVAASTLTGVVVKLPAGSLSDLWGRRTLLRIGAVFFALPPLLYVFVHSAGALLALRFVHGLATAIYGPVASAAIASLSSRGRAARLGFLASARDIGSASGPLVGGFVLAWTASFYDVYWLVGVVGVIALAMIWTLPAEVSIGQIERIPGRSRWLAFRTGLWEVISAPPVLLTSAMEASMMLGYGAFLAFFPIYGHSIGLSVATITLILGVLLATSFVWKPISGWVSDRIGRKPMISLGLVLGAVALPGIVTSRNAIVLGLLSFMLGLSVATVTPSTNAFVADLVKSRNLGAAMGVFGTIWDSGEALGPIIAGALLAVTTYTLSFFVIAIFMLVAVVVFQLGVRDPSAGAASAPA
jgi:MFS transporter, DHA1 family, multidrug resistance protein